MVERFLYRPQLCLVVLKVRRLERRVNHHRLARGGQADFRPGPRKQRRPFLKS
jgi:hypothetical protein